MATSILGLGRGQFFPPQMACGSNSSKICTPSTIIGSAHITSAVQSWAAASSSLSAPRSSRWHSAARPPGSTTRSSSSPSSSPSALSTQIHSRQATLQATCDMQRRQPWGSIWSRLSTRCGLSPTWCLTYVDAHVHTCTHVYNMHMNVVRGMQHVRIHMHMLCVYACTQREAHPISTGGPS